MSALPRPASESELSAAAPGQWEQSGAGALAHQWNASPWIVRISSFCLIFFYLFAAASPIIAPYDPVRQYRSQPDCPPMALHLTLASERSHGWFFAYPMKMVN